MLVFAFTGEFLRTADSNLARLQRTGDETY